MSVAQAVQRIHDITMEIVLITPDTAAAMLASQAGNRSVRSRKIDRLCGLLKLGRWYPGVGSIVFDREGVMIDGQHRLLAIIETGVSAHIIVVRGVHPDAKYWIDTGAVRTGKDALDMAGVESYSAEISSALSLLLRFKRSGHVNTLWHPENEDLRDAYEAYPDIEESVTETKAARTSTLWGSHGTFAFLHYLFSRQDSDAAEDFFRGVLSGIGIESTGDTRHLLRMRLLDEAKQKSKIPQQYVVALAFKAWSVWRSGEERNLLRVRTRGPASEGLPDIGNVPGIWPAENGSKPTP